MAKNQRRRLNPIMSTGAEYLVMGYLMRKNIQTFKAPECNEGYDLLCVNPNIVGIAGKKFVRVQVKSRAAWDCDGGFIVKSDGGRIDVSGFDYLIAVFLNAVSQGDGRYRGFARQDILKQKISDPQPVEFLVFSAKELKEHPEWMSGGRLRLSHKSFNFGDSLNDKGLDKIVRHLKIHNAE